MKKNIIKILLVMTIIFNISITLTNAAQAPNTWVSGVSTNQYDLKIDSNDRMWNNWINNEPLNKLINWDENLIKPDQSWEIWAYQVILKVAQSLKNIFLALATIYFLITILKLLFSEWSSEEEFGKFKKWFIWITVWIIVMQISYSYVKVIYNKKIGVELAGWIIANIIDPLLKLLETAVAFFFIWIMLFSFYKLVTAWWDEEKAKQWKLWILHAFIWFIVVRLSSFIVSAVYSKTLCSVDWVSCNNEKQLSDWAKIIFIVINWLNWFVGLVVILMIVYTGFKIIFSGWEDDKIKTAKKSILYIITWIVILILNYFILTFFLTPKLLN